jgi:hypothetical protein
VQWFVTKESGSVPRLCEGIGQLVASYPGVLAMRPASGLFVVKAIGQAEQCELVVVPLARSTVEWFEEDILRALLEAVRSGDWNGVEHIFHSLLCQPSCIDGCDECACEQKELWVTGGWRRVLSVELNVVDIPGWWKGVTDAVGEDPRDGKPWLRCPCGTFIPW